MMNDEDVVRSLRAALPRVEVSGPSRDLWPAVMQRTHQPVRWSMADWSAAAVVVLALLMFPKWFWFLAYHL
jgi:hypothetical protein